MASVQVDAAQVEEVTNHADETFVAPAQKTESVEPYIEEEEGEEVVKADEEKEDKAADEEERVIAWPDIDEAAPPTSAEEPTGTTELSEADEDEDEFA